MAQRLERETWEDIIKRIVKTTRKHVRALSDGGERRKLLDLCNERVYHHQFSSYLHEWWMEQGANIWDAPTLEPEAPTEGEFSWGPLSEKPISCAEAEALKPRVLKGQRGNHDFLLRTDPSVRIEWKGPLMYTAQDMAEVCLKLLHTVDTADPKLIFAILLSSKTGGRSHLDAIRDRFLDGLRFSLCMLGSHDVADQNLFAYLVTIGDESERGNDLIQTCHWGRVTSLDAEKHDNWVPRRMDL